MPRFIETNNDIFNITQSALEVVLEKRNWNYTDFLEKKLKEYCPEHEIMKKNKPTYESGLYFEAVMCLWLSNVLNFEFTPLNAAVGDAIWGKQMEAIVPKRTFKCQVPYMSNLSYMYQERGEILPLKKQSKTEYVMYVKDAIPTGVFPSSCFNDDGSLEVRLEMKTQNVSGTAYKKNEGSVPELCRGAPEKNIIFLMTGHYLTKDHYDVAKYMAEKCEGEKILKVMNEKEFAEWSEKAFPIS